MLSKILIAATVLVSTYAQTIVDVVNSQTTLSTLAQALIDNSLVDTLNDGAGTFTLFAPTNDVIAAFNAPITQAVLTYHVVSGTKYDAASVPSTLTSLTTVNGASFDIIKSSGVTITDAAGRTATVTSADVGGVNAATNGVVHIIDSVLEYRDIVQLVVDNSDLDTLESVLTSQSLTATLSGPGPFTVLAPTNAAFAAITAPSGDALTQTLLYHVAGASIPSSALSDGLIQPMSDALNQTVTAYLSGGAGFYDSFGRRAFVSVADIIGTNGIIHIIDMVLSPDGDVGDITSNIANISILDGALTANQLDDVLLDESKTYTLFAPSNLAVGAFKGSITSSLLTYHLVEGLYTADDVPVSPTELTTYMGSKITVSKSNGVVTIVDATGAVSTVTVSNVKGINGVVHVVDTVLEYRTIAQLVEDNTDLSTLAGALTANGLDTVLNDTLGTFTLFAPSDAVIAAFNAPITQAVLTYHVVSGTAYDAASVPTTLTNLTTVQGSKFAVIRDSNGVTITDATGMSAMVTTSDIVGSNGVIHIIDSVLEYRDIVQLVVDNSDLGTLESVLTSQQLVATLQGPGPFTVLAPTNAAFAAITAPTGDALTQVLLYHVASAQILSTDLADALVQPMLDADSQTVTAYVTGGAAFYDSFGRKAMVSVADIVGTNGVIHIIDIVLSPFGTVGDITGNIANLSTLDAALEANELDDVLIDTANTYTLFAPTNAAITAVTDAGADITADILTHHVVSGKTLADQVPTSLTDLTTVQGETLSIIADDKTGAVTLTDANGNTASVTMANIAGQNGVVHIIDSVLLPKVATTMSPSEMPTMSPTADDSSAYGNSAFVALIVGAIAALV